VYRAVKYSEIIQVESVPVRDESSAVLKRKARRGEERGSNTLTAEYGVRRGKVRAL
jgi:hypothetical protein